VSFSFKDISKNIPIPLEAFLGQVCNDVHNVVICRLRGFSPDTTIILSRQPHCLETPWTTIVVCGGVGGDPASSMKRTGLWFEYSLGRMTNLPLGVAM